MNEKLAVVTGSSRGIGSAIARALLREGYRTVLTGVRSAESAEETLRQCRAIWPECEYFRCDISREADRDGLFAFLSERYGRLDVLVNNAGVAPLVRQDLLETTPESFDRVLGVNLRGTFFMCQAAARLMLRTRSACGCVPRIVNISSVSAYAASVNRPEYCISKAGVSMVTRLFADRLAEEGIRVFEIRPGIIRTDMTAAVQDQYSRMIADGLTPIRRFGEPEDVADMVLAICSGRLDFTTGQVLNADGGFHLRRL